MLSRSSIRRIIKIISYSLGLFFLAVFIRVFMLEIYYVPSPSMMNTIIPGDVLVVNKLKYGARIPGNTRDLPWVNCLIKERSLPSIIKRAPGYGKIERFDIVLFNPADPTRVFVKRLIGLPGDTIQVRNAETFINAVKITPDATTLHKRYTMEKNKTTLKIADDLDLWVKNRQGDSLLVYLDQDKYDTLIQRYPMLSPASIYPDSVKQKAYPWESHERWSIDFYGPYVIPYKGMQINLDHEMLHTYAPLIRQYEVDTIQVERGHVYIEGRQVSSYTFKHNYYFMMGDQRYESSDSRIWGPIPEDHIIGKTGFVLVNDKKTSISWRKIK